MPRPHRRRALLVTRTVRVTSSRTRRRVRAAVVLVGVLGTAVGAGSFASQRYASAAPGDDCSADSPLGVAGHFAEFIETDSQRVSETEGRVAVGHDLTVTGPFSVGSVSDGYGPDGLELIVGGTIHAQARVVVAGGASYLALDGSGPLEATPSLQQAPPFDIPAEFERLRARADSWAGLVPNGTVQVLPYPTRAELVGTDPSLNVFAISAGDLGSITEWYLQVPAGSTTLVNVEGTGTIDVTALTSLFVFDPVAGRYVLDDHFIGGKPPPSDEYLGIRSRLLWNLPGALTFRKGPSSWPGTILAPRAAFEFGQGTAVGPGVVNGSVIARSMTSSPGAGTHHFTFLGCLGAPLTVEKVIVGSAAGLQGAVTVRITCDDGTAATWRIPAGSVDPAPFTLGGLRPGTTCTVAETGDGATAGVDVTVSPPQPQTVTIGSADTVTITNTYERPPTRVLIGKTITGDGAGQQGLAHVWVTCDDGTRADFTIPAGATTAGPFAVGPLPPGTTCDVEEAPDGDSAAVDVEVAGTGQVVTPASGDVSVALTNAATLRSGRLEITKTITGAAAGDQGDITVTVDCQSSPPVHEELPIAAGATGSTTVTVDDVPAGALCQIGERVATVPGVAVVLADGPLRPVVVTAGSTTTVELTNLVESSGLIVTKRTVGDDQLRGPVTIEVTCDDGSGPFSQTWPRGGVLAPLVAAPITPGATCDVTETADGSNANVDVEVGGDLDADTATRQVVVPSDDPIVVEAVNTYRASVGALVVTKAVEGPGADQRGPIEIAVSCSDGSVASDVFEPGDPLTPIELVSIDGGASCTVTEIRTGATPSVAVDADIVVGGAVASVTPRATTAEVTVPIVEGELTHVAITDRYTPIGAIAVTKTVDGPEASGHGPIAVVVACADGSTGLGTLAAGAPGPLVVTVDAVPVGTPCTVLELVDGSTAAVDVEVDGVPSQPVVVTSGTTAVGITNTYTAAPGRLTVTKRVTGPDAGNRSTVTLAVACLARSSVTTQRFDLPPGDPLDPIEIAPVEAGAQCTVVEPDAGGSTAVDVATAFVPAASAMIGAGDDASITVVNDYRRAAGRLRLDIRLTGPAVAQRGDVRIAVVCDDGTEVTTVVPVGQLAQPYVIGGLPPGAACTLHELDTGATAGIDVAVVVAPQETAHIVPGATARVIVTNRYTAQPGPTDPTTTTSTSTTTPPGPIPPTTVPDPGPTSPGPLPATGASSGAVAIAALVLLASGLALLATRRRRPASRR